MTKESQQIINMIQTAMRNGVSKQGAYDIRYYKEDDIFIMSHYGTKIMQVNQGKIVRLGGYSQSDANAISTALKFMGFDFYVTKTKSREKNAFGTMDGWFMIKR